MPTESKSKTDTQEKDKDYINYYLILGLEYDPPVMDIKIINERIDKCKIFWSTNINKCSSDIALFYKNYLSLIDKIKADMADASVRTAHSDFAKSHVTERVRQYLQTAAAKSSPVPYEICTTIISSINNQLERELPRVLPHGVDANGKLQNVGFASEPLVSRIASELNISIAEKEDYKALYNKYYKNPPAVIKTNLTTYNDYHKALNNVGKADLYEYLGMAKSDSVATLSKAADARCQIAFKNDKNNTESEIEKKLAGGTREVFKDDATKEKYDLYLSWKNARSVFERIKDENLAGTLQKEHLHDFITELKDSGIPETDVGVAIDAYCQKEKIDPPWPPASDNGSKYIICSGCCRIETNTAVSACPECKTPLRVSCPNCGKETPIGLDYAVCKHCKSSIKDVSKALFKYYLARKSIEVLDYDTAKLHLKDADLLWPKSSESERVKNEISSSEKNYGKDLEGIKTAAAEKRYFAADELYQKLQNRFPGYHDLRLKSDITYAKQTAEEFVKSITPQSTEKEILGICAKVSLICADHPRIINLMGRYPPEPVKNVTAIFDKRAKVVNLKWEKSSSPGDLSYVIVRKENNAPGTPEDGERIGMTPISNYTDTSIKAGKCYYYAVFTQRTGVISSGVTLPTPVITNFTLSGLKLTPENRAVRISWQMLPSTASVQILRDGKEIQQVPGSGYLDSNLQNDVQYAYKVRLVYTINGKKYDSDWIEGVATPSLPPESVSTLRIRSIGKNQYQASWTYEGKDAVELYCSEEKPPHNMNDAVPVYKFQESMQKLPARISGTSATFQYSSLKTLYVTAVVLKNGMCYIGNFARVTNNQIFAIKDVKLVNGEIVIWFDKDVKQFPSDVTGFKIMYSFDSYPMNPDDSSHPKDQKIYVNLKQFKTTETLKIPNPVQKDYYITIFVQVKSGIGDSDFPYSCEAMFSNTPMTTIRYSLHKPLFTRTWKIIFETEGFCTLPAIEMSYLAGRGYAPLRKEDGKVIQHIPEQEINRKLSIELELPRDMPSGSHVKPFIVDNAKRRKIQLILDDNETTLIS